MHADRLGLALERERLDRLDVHGVPDQPVGRVPEQDLAGAGRLLEAGRDVDGVARREPLARARVARHHLAGVDAGAHRDLDAPLGHQVDVQTGERVAHLDGRAHGPQRVVLVHHRDAEDGHDGVTDELLDRAAVPLDDGAHLVEVAGHDAAQRLGVEPLAERSRAA